MVEKIMKFVVSAVGVFLGYVIVESLRELGVLTFQDRSNIALLVYLGISMLFGIIFFILSPKIIRGIKRLVNFIEEELQKIPFQQIVIGTIGLIIGLFIAYLVSQPFYKIDFPFLGVIISILLYAILGYLGMMVPTKKTDDIMAVFASLKKDGKITSKNSKANRYCPKILDTSVIIDGRIFDICKTGFIEGPLVIPQYVLGELQSIADSSDGLKRNRGRRGLDILNKIQKELDIEVIIHEKKFEDIKEVDSKLLKLTQEMKGKIITNDYNLNKVAEVQGIEVLNINDLANAVKPVVLPGELMKLHLVKEGKEHGQGLAYLDDGTMIVVEGGKKHIGENIDVMVTSVLQTSAGRMIFGKPNGK